MKLRFIFSVKELFMRWGLNEQVAQGLNILIGIVVILFLVVLSDVFTRKVLIGIITRLSNKTKTSWDDILLEKRVFHRLAHIVPAIVLHYSIRYVFMDYPETMLILHKLIYIYLVIMVTMVIVSSINAFHGIYISLPVSKNRSIQGYVQVVKIIIYLFAALFLVSILLQKNLTTLFAGLGAMAAILLLIFKDTILSLVASIQIAAYDMIRPGDWITVPGRDADGDVIDISLNTVKVQNWDKTITTIPTYALVNESFNNWRGMQESGGRRIKRSINIDMKSVRFCTPEMLKKFKKIIYLKEYIEEKEKEIEQYNIDNRIDPSIVVNGRRMTNIGSFRKYLECYLKNHPMINTNLTFLIRQLQPTEKGMPIEIYVFSKDQRWANYESIQADIFDHIMAVIPEFDLRIFQNPTGEDFRQLLS